MINCPKCSAAAEDEAKECQACGIFFSNWKLREENLASGNMSRYQSLATATSSEFNWIILGIVCTALIGLFYLIGQRAQD